MLVSGNMPENERHLQDGPRLGDILGRVNSATSGSPFSRVVDQCVKAGLLEAVLPVIPPHATTAERFHRNRGKIPGQYTGGNSWDGYRGWTRHSTTPADVARWRKWPGAGLCIRTALLRAVDIDVEASGLAAALDRLVRERIGPSVLVRTRGSSPRRAFLFRLEGPVRKRRFVFKLPGDDLEHAVELLGDGQQLVIAGQHPSGMDYGLESPGLNGKSFDDIPSLTLEQLDTLWAEIQAIITEAGGEVIQNAVGASRQEQDRELNPAQTVMREIFRRRDAWVPEVLSIVPGQPDRDWRIGAAELGREGELDEDLVVFRDGVRDFGTERQHDPISLIREFGAVGPEGDIEFGGCPEYGHRDGQPYAVVGEHDPAVRRPSEGEAIAWLSRCFSGPAIAPTVTRGQAMPALAKAVGLDWTDLLAKEAGPYWDQQLADQAAAAAMSAAESSSKAIWGEPIDIFGGASPTELAEPPAGSLPEVIDRVARDEANRKGVPLAFAAISFVTAVGAAIGCSLRIRPRLLDDGWTEPAALWAVLVAPPGSAKSPIIGAATAQLKRLDGKWYEDFARQRQMWAEAKQAAKKGKPIAQEPKCRRIVVDDATMERQIQIHADNPRGLLRLPDEYVGLLGSLGAYKKGPDADRGHMLRLFDGGAVGVDRVGSGSTRADSALMAMLAGTQPEKLQKLVRDLGADGMLQRTLFIMHDGRERRGQDAHPDRAAAAAYDFAIRALVEGKYPFGTVVELSDAAYRVLEEAKTQISTLTHIPGMSEAWGGHVEKWGRILPRITLIFHALDQIALFDAILPGSKVDRSTAERAVKFACFILRHSLQFYLTYFEPNPAASEARQIAGYILTKPDIQVLTRRDIYLVRKSLRGDRGHRALQLAMSELSNASWCEPGARDEHEPKEWLINPKVHGRFTQRAEWEREERSRKQALIALAGKNRRTLLDDNLAGEAK